MTNNAHIAHAARDTSHPVSRITRQISPRLAVAAAGLAAVGIATGFVQYLHRSPIREAHVPGTSAWVPQLAVAAVACALYGAARWRHDRRPGRDGRDGRPGSEHGSGRLLLLAPLGRTAASRLRATMRQVSWRHTSWRHTSWRPAAALPPLAVIAYCCWRIGEQITGGLDPNFTVNAWGGPTYLGAMACHYLDIALIIGVSAWLLDLILLPADA
jgi:hypothetical protein